MKCPKCGNEHLHTVTEVEGKTTSKKKGFGAIKGCLGFLIFGWFGWLCGLCGMGKGKSKTTTTSTTYWMCNKCGNRFKA